MGTLLIRPPGHRRDVALRPAASAMVWVGEGRAHETIAVPGVALADHDVLVAVELSTICASDVHAVVGERSAPAPLVLGHESVGRVIATGDKGASAVDGAPVRIGDRVVWAQTVACASCDQCAEGMPQRCRERVEYGHERIGAHGELSGAFATHIQLREGTAIARVPETLPAAALAPACCAAATAWAAVAEAASQRDLAHATVRVYGAGLLGLSVAAIAADRGATVEVHDPDPQRQALGLKFGASLPLSKRPDVVIETSGVAAADAVRGAATGALVVLLDGALSFATPTRNDLELDAEDVVLRALTIMGVRGTTAEDLGEAVAFLCGRGRAYPFAEAVGAIHPLADLDEALREAAVPNSPLRVGLRPGR